MYDELAQRRVPMHRLMTMFKFDQYDLQANRDGYMSTRQRTRFRNLRRNYGLICIGLPVAMSLWLLLLTSGLMTDAQGRRVILVLGISAVIGISSGYFVFRRLAQRISADLHKGDVSVVEGRIRVEEYAGKYIRQALVINDVMLGFQGTGQPRRVIESHASPPYVVYYAPNTYTILSLEPLEDNEV